MGPMQANTKLTVPLHTTNNMHGGIDCNAGGNSSDSHGGTGAGIHNGRLWHGSGRNRSRTQPRRGLGIHFVPADARFRDAENGYETLAHRFRDPSGGNALPDHAFPVTWTM